MASMRGFLRFCIWLSALHILVHLRQFTVSPYLNVCDPKVELAQEGRTVLEVPPISDQIDHPIAPLDRLLIHRKLNGTDHHFEDLPDVVTVGTRAAPGWMRFRSRLIRLVRSQVLCVTSASNYAIDGFGLHVDLMRGNWSYPYEHVFQFSWTPRIVCARAEDACYMLEGMVTGHVQHDAWPMLMVLAEFGPPGLTCVIPQSLWAHHIFQQIAAWTFPVEQILVIPDFACVLAKRVWMTSPWRGGVRTGKVWGIWCGFPHGVDLLRQKIRSRMGLGLAPADRHILLQRGGTRSRIIGNLEEIRDAFTQMMPRRVFEIFVSRMPDGINYTLGDQIRFASAIKFLFQAEGSDCVHLVYMPAGGMYVEVRPSWWPFYHVANLALNSNLFVVLTEVWQMPHDEPLDKPMRRCLKMKHVWQIARHAAAFLDGPVVG